MKKKVIVLSIVLSILFFVIGYIIGPSEHPPGRYKIYVQLSEEANLTVYGETQLGERGVIVQNSSKLIVGRLNLTLVIVYQSSYERRPGKTFWAYIFFFVNSKKQKLFPDSIEAYLITPNNKIEPMHVKFEGEDIKIEKPIRIKSKLSFAFFLFLMPLWSIAAINQRQISLLAIILLIPIFSCVFLRIDPYQIIPIFFDPIIALIFGIFIITLATIKHGLSERIALFLASKARGFLTLMLVLTLFAMFISMWFTPLMAIILMLPTVNTILKIIGKGVDDPHARAIILSTLFGAMCGGMLTIIGSPANMLSVTIAKRLVGLDITLLEWSLYAIVPTFLVMFVTISFVYLKYLRKASKFDSTKLIVLEASYKGLGPMKREEKITIIIILLIIFLWILHPIINIPLSSVPLIGAFILLAFGLMDANDLRSIPWNLILILGGSLVLSQVIYSTGIIDFLLLEASNLGAAGILFLIIVGFLMSFVLDQPASVAITLPLLLLAFKAKIIYVVFMSIIITANLLSPSSMAVQSIIEERGIKVYHDFKEALVACIILTVPIFLTISFYFLAFV